MRFPTLAMGLVAFSILSVPAQSISESIKVVGIVDLPNYRCALLQRLAHQTPFGEHLMLKEGQREGELEVVEINPEEGTAKIRLGKAEESLKMGELPAESGGTAGKKTIVLRQIRLQHLLNVYGQLSGKTLLRHPQLAEQNLTLTAAPADQAEAATVLEKALADREIACIKDGDKFIMVVPRSQEKNVKPKSAELDKISNDGAAIRALATNARQERQMIQPGTIDFREADLASAAVFYAMVLGGNLDRENLMTVRGTPITLKTETAITQAEVRYALETLFAWQGYKAVKTEGGTIRFERLDGK
jgi:hypothetical protein